MNPESDVHLVRVSRITLKMVTLPQVIVASSVSDSVVVLI